MKAEVLRDWLIKIRREELKRIEGTWLNKILFSKTLKMFEKHIKELKEMK